MTSNRDFFVKMWLICGALIFGLPYVAHTQAKRHLVVSDIAGYYVTSDRSAIYQTLSLVFIGKTSTSGQFEQGNFTGNYSNFPIVGQGIISGDEGRLDNFIRFDFMYLEPQDETLLLHSTSIMSDGRVTGLLINEAGSSSDSRKQLAVRYRRVSHEQFVKFQRAKHV